MTPEAASQLMLALGTKSEGHHGVWMRGKCPLAPYRHQSGKDTNPSFGLYVEEGSRPRFHCFTCESGSIEKLLQLLEKAIAEKKPFHGDLAKAREILESAESELPVLPVYAEFNQQQKRKFEELPGYLLDTYMPAIDVPRALEFARSRGLLDEEILKHNLRYDHGRDMLLFPYWDVFNRFAGIRGRAIGDHGVKHHDYVFGGVNNSGLVFYNEQVLNLPGPVVVVEGQVDCLKVARLWTKTVGNLTAKPVLEKATKLTQSDGVVVLMDGDETGRAATKKFVDLMVALNTQVLPILLPWDPEAGLKSDPDSVGYDWLKQAFVHHGLLDKSD